MQAGEERFSLEITRTDRHCPAGEKAGRRYIREGRIPVLSCEGPCIRGEIARLAANMVAKEEPYRRGCHGELITVPGSAIAQWIRTADRVVLIDGCFLRCHGRMIENLLDREKIMQFDAHSYYRKFNDNFDIDEVPESERTAVARLVADAVLAEAGKTSGSGAASRAGAECKTAHVTGKGSGCDCDRRGRRDHGR